MIQITLQSIKSYAGSDRRFRAGFLLHQKQNIHSVEPGPGNSLRIKAKEDDGTTYQMTIHFYGDTGTFRYAKCSCHQGQPCEHVIGGLLYVLYKKEALADQISQSVTSQMYTAFEGVLYTENRQSKKQSLGLEVILHPRSVLSKAQSTFVQLKVTAGSTYLIKNIEKFVTAVVEGKTVEITRFMNLGPEMYTISSIDKEVIFLLYDYYKTRQHLLEGSSSQVPVSLKASVQSLPSTYVYRLLNLLGDHPFNIDYDGLYFRNQQLEEQLEIDFYLTEEDNSYFLSVNTYDIFFSLTDDHHYVFYNNQIYRLGEVQANAFQLSCRYLEEKVIEIEAHHLQDFINKVMPVLQRIGFVHLDRTIQEQLVEDPMVATLYIEKVSDDLVVNLSYQYGGYKIDRFPEKELGLDEGILVHDLEKEKTIESLLLMGPHTIREDGHLVYETEEGVYHFVDRQLPLLQNLCDVFYSEDFRHTYMGSTKALISKINYNMSGNLLELDFEMEDVSRGELMSLLMAVKEKKHYYKLQDGSFFTITDELSYQVEALEDRFDLNLSDTSRPLIEAGTVNALYLDQLFEQRVEVDYSQSFRSMIQGLKKFDEVEVEVPKVVDTILRDYQKRGFKWLTTLKKYGFGGILADDMGLGKTLQAITLVLSSESTGPSIVVAPTSLIYNWEAEIHKFVPNAVTRVVAGSKTLRSALIEAIEDGDMVITSYGSLKRDLILYDEVKFDCCFIDEAQHIKNPRSQNARGVKALGARHKYALTGTPIENTLSELWSIFDFVLPGYLGSHEQFVKNFERPIIKDGDTEILKRLTQLIQPFILRRLKEDVLTELPPKIETKVSIELNSHQKKLYAAYIDQAKTEMTTYAGLPEGQKNMKILALLTRLRQLCCHPSLFVDDYHHGSAKMDLLQELIQDSVEAGHRVLVFSQFTMMLGLIKDMLDKHQEGYFYLDGSVPPMKRQQMVHDFNNGTNNVFLISLKAGGTGLNLTGADVVIHYDPWWNPSVEKQATDRAYRIGQRNRVQVYKLISAGTIEERIYELQEKKLQLIDNVISPGETFLDKLSVNELQSLIF